MPDELRVLVFSEAEIVRALYALRSRRGEPLPDGRLLSAEISRRGEITVQLEVRSLGDQRHRFLFEQVDVAAALIVLCINSSIPLPVTARKSLLRVDGGVALVISRGRIPETVRDVVSRLRPIEAAD
jgi:hypothetical protein